MARHFLLVFRLLAVAGLSPAAIGAERPELRIGIAGHAFDHLGNIGEQAEAAVASGATVLYISGVGALGYQGLPAVEQLRQQQQATRSYLHKAKQKGLRLALGYLCATSIVKLETFDQNWPPDFRVRFHARPAEWLQMDRQGRPLASWYGGDYQPACMNNPDWRTYERFMVRAQLEAGCDGIFFDNPTVHPQGCYCRHCMDQFEVFLEREGHRPHVEIHRPQDENSLAALRSLATKEPAAFMRFRCTIARDFLADMREYARSIRPAALITANNSLNSATVLYSQCRNYAYNIFEMSRTEDLVVVEDMSSQARTLANGKSIEYGPTYKQLRAISHGKPVVAVTLADADYHTAPDLVRLSIAEAAANGASHLWWPTWPEEQRQRMIAQVHPEAEFLRQNADLLNGARPRHDLVLFLPFRKWIETDTCKTSGLAAELSGVNAQFEIVCEEDLERTLASGFRRREDKILLAAAQSDFTSREKKFVDKFRSNGGAVITADQADWLTRVRRAIARPSITVERPHTVRATVWDQPHRTIVHLLNLDIQRLSSFEDRVTPAQDVRVRVRVGTGRIHRCRALTADTETSSGSLTFSSDKKGADTFIETTVPRLDIAAILVLD